MKKLTLLIIILSILFGFNVSAQSVSKNKKNQPKIDIKVKIKRDENGNIIGYDSTYTEYYSNSNLKNINTDSLFAELKKQFNGFDEFNNLNYFSNNMFPDFNEIQKQFEQFNNFPNFFPNDSTMLNFPTFPDFSEFDNFFKNNNIKLQQDTKQQTNPTNNNKPKLNPANTYQF